MLDSYKETLSSVHSRTNIQMNSKCCKSMSKIVRRLNHSMERRVAQKIPPEQRSYCQLLAARNVRKNLTLWYSSNEFTISKGRLEKYDQR